MGTYSNVVSTVKPINAIRTFIGGVAKDITSAWTFVNGVRKQVFPTTESWTLVYSKDTAGTDTFNVGWGKYRVEMSAGGGGGGAALGKYISDSWANSAGACGGTGAYGTVDFQYSGNDTLTITVGGAGVGATKTNGTAASTSGGNTSLSDTTHGSNFIVLNGGGAAYAHATNNGDSFAVGTGGTFSTTLGSHNLHNGINGQSGNSATGNRTGANTTNPSPYNTVGFGGGWHYNTNNRYSPEFSASNGGVGYIKIYKSNIYPA